MDHFKLVQSKQRKLTLVCNNERTGIGFINTPCIYKVAIFVLYSPTWIGALYLAEENIYLGTLRTQYQMPEGLIFV